MKKVIALNSHGRVVGENHPRARLLDSEIDQLFELHEAGFSYSQIAAKMDLSKSGVAHVISGRRRCQTPDRYVEVSVPD